MCGARDMAFPYVNMLSYWAFVVAVLVLLASFFVPGGPTGAGWTLYPPQAITAGTPGSDMGIILMLISLILFVAGFTMGGLNYIITVLQLRARGMTLMRLTSNYLGNFYSNCSCDVCVSSFTSRLFNDDIRQFAWNKFLYASYGIIR